MAQSVAVTVLHSPLVRDTAHTELRWSSQSYNSAIRAAQIGGLVGAQVLLIGAALLSELRVEFSAVLAVHALVAALGVATLSLPRVWMGWFFGTFCLSVAIDYAASESITDPLATLAFVLFLPAATIPLTISRQTVRATLAVLTFSLLVSASIVWSHPEWDLRIALTSAAGLITISLLGAGQVRRLHSLTERADRMSAEAAKQQQRAARSRSSTHAAAEAMRLLHDTVVNTFASLASPGRPALDEREVRERCQEDLDRIDAFFTDAHAARVGAFTWQGRGLLPVVETGMSHAELLRYTALLPEGVADAIEGCVVEVMRNATKHSGADRIAFDARIQANALVITVSDTGSGFDGTWSVGRGLAESFFARAHDAGITVALDTAPGQGTSARITTALGALAEAEGPETPIPLDETITAMRRSVAWIPALPALGATLAQLLTEPFSFTLAHVAVAITGALALLMWLAGRGVRALPTPLTVAVVLAIPAIFILTLTSTDLPTNAYAFPALMLAVLPIVLDALARRRTAYGVSILLCGVVLVGYLAFGPTLAPDDIVLLFFLLTPTLCVLAAWHIFDHEARRVARSLAEAYVQSHRAQLEAARGDAAASIRERLSASGLADSLDLLRGIADGTLDPSSAHVHARCRDEERHLRQLLALPIDSPEVSRWLSVALARARSMEVGLNLRTEDVHIDDVEIADAFGRVILSRIAVTRAGTDLVISIIGDARAQRLFIVGERNDHASAGLAALAGLYPVSVEHLGEQTLVEVVAATR